jgi:hypothetical protein
MDLGQKANGKISLGVGHLRGHFSIYVEGDTIKRLRTFEFVHTFYQFLHQD